ncbi:MAG: aspartate aminotransferase family protein [bacterium]|nr:aspartate aminotransferase family protein [bacterium]
MQALRTSSAEIGRRRAASVPRGVGCVHPIAVVRGEGATLWDADGRAYVDFVGGIGVMNAGHANPAIVDAIAAQARAFTHVSFQVTSYEPYVALAETLNRIAPGPSRKKTLLLSTGAEATENAVKIARHYTGRPGVIAFQHGYHGRTLLALSMTGKNAPYKQNYGPFCSEIVHAPFPHELHGWSVQRALDALDEIFASTISPERVAAIIIEPVLGEGGFVPVPHAYMQALRDRCTREGIVLICDEIQSGFGRTGAFFASEHYGIEPDLVTTAKSLAGGMPLAAVVGKAEIMDAPGPGGLGGTYAGNPVACAAALATIDLMDGAFFARAGAIGARVRSAFDDLAARYPADVAEVRGIGAMIGIEFVQRDEPVVARIVERARERGVLLMPAGEGNVIRVLVPLVIDDAMLNDALAHIADAVHDVLGSPSTGSG